MDINKVNSAFEAACIAVKTLTKRPSDDDLLELFMVCTNKEQNAII